MHAAAAAAAAAESSECWDVEAEIARELQNLATEGSYAVPVSLQQQQQPQVEPPGADVQALWAAIARDHLADKLTATLHELESLPSQPVKPSTRAPETASPDQVTAAVAALLKVTGHDEGQHALQAAAAGASPVLTSPDGKQHQAAEQGQAAQPVKAAAASAGTQLLHPAAHVIESKPPQADPQHVQEDAADSPHQVDCAPAAAEKPSTPPSPEAEAPVPPRPLLSPPRTPNTQEARQHVAAPLLTQHSKQQQPQPSVVLEPSTGEDSADTVAAPAPAGHPARMTQAAAVAAAVTEEQAAAAEASRQQAADRHRLQQLLDQQAAGAAARHAAQETARQQLKQQAEAAAVSYMAAWRIARAWQNYRRSPAHAEKLAAVITLQAAVRGAVARQLLQQTRRRYQLLTALHAAASSGQLDALQHAATEASSAGLQAEAQQALTRFQAAAQAAARDLQAAAETGTHAAFAAAAAAAATYSTPEAACNTCAARFKSRQEAAAQAVQAAVSALPLPQVQCAVNVALELGVPGRDLAAAVEAARARDAAAVARLSSAVQALSAQSDCILSGPSTPGAGPATAGKSPGSSSSGSRGGSSVLFDASDFWDAVAACRQYGKMQEAAAADAALQQCRQLAAAQLAQAAEAADCAGAVQELLSWCSSLGGLQQECAAAAGRLSARQQQLCSELTALLAQPACTEAAAQQLLQRARALEVPAEALTAAEARLRDWQAAAEQQCLEAARSGSLQQLRNAVATAKQCCSNLDCLQHCWEVMQERQQGAAKRIAAAAAVLCAAVLGAGVVASDAEAVLQGLAQQCHRCTVLEVTNSSSEDKEQQQQQQRQQDKPPDSVGVLLQELQLQAICCLKLGLTANVAAAVQAAALACQAERHKGASSIASCSLPLDGGDLNTQQQDQMHCLWEEGTLPEQSWVQDGASTHATLPTWAAWCAANSRGCSSSSSSSRGSGSCTNIAAETACGDGLQPCALTTPVLQLQQQWAANLAGALACTETQSTACEPAPPRQLLSQPEMQPARQPLPAQQQEAHNWLRKLLLANAAAPLDQLTQLDLSLEQLPGLHGLDAMCPQLTSIAVNMNGLKSLEGLRGCCGLLQLSAQDNQLQQLPDICCHPQLTSLLLDSNKLSSIISAADSRPGNSSSSMRQPHCFLQTLSLTNNQLTSICSGLSRPSSSSSSVVNGAGSSGCRIAEWKDQGLSLWLPGLQMLQLSGNQLPDLNGLQGCSNLRVLDVSRNHLTDVQGLAGCHLLQQLDASENRLTSFPAQLQMPLLQRLNLSCNALSTWPTLPPLPHLVQLSLADNQIQQLPEMHGLLQLRALDLSFNQLQDLCSCVSALQTAPQLQELQLHDNAFHANWDQQQQQRVGAEQLPWLAAAAGGVGAAAAYDAWVREQVGSGLPWLMNLDGDDIAEAERLPRRLLWQGQPAALLLQQQQLELELQQHEQQAAAGHGGQATVAVATGHLVARNSLLSLLLHQQFKAGPVGGLGLVQPQCASAAGEQGVEMSRSAACVQRVAALQAAAAWFPHLAQLQLAGVAPTGRVEQGLASEQRLPCQHLQQALQPGSGCCCCGGCSASWRGEPSTSSSSSSSVLQCTCPAWLRLVEALWCYSTRAWLVQAQVAQQAVATKASSGSFLHQPDNGSHRSKEQQQVAGPSAAGVLARRHLLQLQQDTCKQHQQQLVVFTAHNAGMQQQHLLAAAVLLQSLWRGHAARLQLQQDRQQGAALVLQALWRGRRARQAVAAAQQQRQQDQAAAAAAAAAAVRIQAALRGHKVRQRLKAALSSARAAAAGPPGTGPGHAAPSSKLHQVAAGSQAGAEGQLQGWQGSEGSTDTEAWDFEGVPDDFVTLQPELLSEDLLMQADVSQHGVQQGQTVPLQQQGCRDATVLGFEPASSQSASSGSAMCPTASLPTAAGSLAAAVGPEAAAEAVCMLRSSDAGGGGGVTGHDAKILALMAEWGFADRATAEAYYKRQKHTLKAVAKHKLEQQLKDPAARLKRLQAQLGSSPAVSGPSSAAAAANMAPTADNSPAASTHARRSSEPGRIVSKQLSLQQQRSKAAEPFSRVSSMSGGGSSTVRVLQGVSAKQQLVPGSSSLPRSSSQKQHQGLVLPSIAASSFGGSPGSSSSTAAGAVHQSVGGGLPKLQRL